MVWGDSIFLTCVVDKDLVLLAYDTKGKEKWQAKLGTGNVPARTDEGNWASASAVTDGKNVWAFVGSGDLACYSVDGKKAWAFNLQERYGKFNIQFGMHSTPILHDGKFKALATTWTQRLSAYPQLSTATEQGFPELKIAHWAGVHAPKGTPPEILDKMAAAIDQAMKDPAIAQRLKALGIEPIGGTRADFVRFTNEERKRLGEIVRVAKMKDN